MTERSEMTDKSIMRVKVDKRQMILDAAGRLLARRRFADLAVEDVADEANIAKGTVYLYFDSKDAIYLAYKNQMVQPLLASLREEVAATDSAIAAIELIVREVVEFARLNPAMCDIMQGTTRASQQATQEKTKVAFRQLVIDVIKGGIRTGELRDVSPDLAADMVLAALPRVIERMPRQQKTLQAAARQVVNIFANGLLANKSLANQSLSNKALEHS